jgi:2-oxoisovalerate dehydrogenase E1 component
VVHEDRVFSSVGREIQGAVIEAMPGEHVVTRVLGQEPVPGIPQNIHLEHRIAVSPEKIVDAAMQVMAIKWHEAAASAVPRQVTTPSPAAAAPTRTRVLWTPNRHFVS